MPQITQVYNGDWVDVTDGTITACCDCGLTHTEQYAVLDGRILRMCSVSKKGTRARRRAQSVKDSIRMIYRKIFGEKKGEKK